MKCTTCQQTDFSSIHGRIFCANCGVNAAKRLHAFQPRVSPANSANKIGGGHALDLSQSLTKQTAPPSYLETTGQLPTPEPVSTPIPDETPEPISPPASTDVHTPQPVSEPEPTPTHSPSPEPALTGPSTPPPNLHQVPQTPPVATELPQTPPTPINTVRANSISGISKPLSTSIPAATDLRENSRWKQVAAQNSQADDGTLPNTVTAAQPAPPSTSMQPHQTYKLKEEETPQLSELNLSQDLSQEETMTDGSPQQLGRLSNLFKSRLWRTATVGLSMLLLAGYVTYLNYPGIAVRVAANRANIEAHLPGYVPVGYGFSGPVAYNPGQLTITFRGGDGGGIKLTQSTTRWDSRSLLEDHVKLRTSTYDTYRENGLTIYTYDGRHAVWVNSGMLYEIESDNELVADEIIRMASSL